MLDPSYSDLLSEFLAHDVRWLRQGRSPLLIIPAAFSLAAFVWLLTLHPTTAGRTYAAYGGVYVAVAMAWLWVVDKQRPTAFDIAGALVAVAGMAIIVIGARRSLP